MATQIADLSHLFPEGTNTVIDVSTVGDTTTYTLLVDLTVSDELSFSEANIPHGVNNIIFDGDGHTVTYDDGVTSNGLFKTTNGASYDITIKNLGVIDGITATNAGFICATEFGRGSSGIIVIENCYSTGAISGGYSGGISGRYFGTGSQGTLSVENCYSTGEISGDNSGGISGSEFGTFSYGTLSIENCYSTGAISGDNSGGISGRYFGLESQGTSTFSINNVYADSQNYTNINNYQGYGSYTKTNVQTNLSDFESNLDVSIWDTSVEPPIFQYQSTASSASTSGDPHIFPAFGNMYELPQTPGMYRMLQAPGLVLNASTKKLTTKQKNDIAHYCAYYGILDSMIHSLVMNGVFYDSVYLSAEGHSMSFNFNAQRLKISKEASTYFSFGQKHVENTKIYNNAYETCKNITQFQVLFEHSTHGKVTIDLNYFSNPQIKYGIGFSAKKAKLRSFSGLLIREYACKSMEVSELRDVEKKKGIEEKNTVTSKFVVIKK